MMKMRKQSSVLQDASNKQLKSTLKNKMYVPIGGNSVQAISHENIDTRNIGDMKQTRITNPPEVNELRRHNIELQQKQRIYIQKLIKLEEGLQKQHSEFMQLQDHYNELFSSYKLKEEETNSMEARFRESDRKKCGNTAQTQKLNDQIDSLTRVIETKTHNISQLQTELSEKSNSLAKLEKEHVQLHAQINYLKGKEKMNDSKASLSSKVFDELQDWQKRADHEKQERIKLQYQNEFLKDRNMDLEKRVGELEAIIVEKQTCLANLRKNNIQLHRENSVTRLNRSRSRSPQASSSPRQDSVHKGNVIEKLNTQNRRLTGQIEHLKEQLRKIQQQPAREKHLNFDSKNSSSIQGNMHINEGQFFSFSRDELPVMSTIQRGQSMLPKPQQDQNYNQLNFLSQSQPNIQKQEDHNINVEILQIPQLTP